jgi:site-specific DNA-methyltransferase (adenine-specific)
MEFADSPYNLGVNYGKGYNDKLPKEKYLEWCRQWMELMARVLAPDGSLWILISSEWADKFGCMLQDIGLHRRSWVIWYESFGPNNPKGFTRSTRHLFHMVKNPKKFVFNPEAVTRPSARQTKYGDKRANPNGRIWDDAWGIDPPIPQIWNDLWGIDPKISRVCGTFKERIEGFPTQLPIKLLLPIIGCSSNPGDLIIDPFSGSGTTGAAALQLGRRYLGIEQNPEFVRLSRERLTNVTNHDHTPLVRPIK